MPRVQSPVSSREAFYDRNAEQRADADLSTLDEGTGPTDVVSYTVPSGKKGMVTHISASLLARVAASTTDVNATVFVRIIHVPSGGSQLVVLQARMQSSAYVAGDRVGEVGGGQNFLAAGDNMRFTVQFSGDAAGAGDVLSSSGMMATEFDA